MKKIISLVMALSLACVPVYANNTVPIEATSATENEAFAEDYTMETADISDPESESFTLTGTIRNATTDSADYGNGIAGMSVTCKKEDGTTFATTTTAADGTFSVTFTEEGKYLFVLEKAGFQSFTTAALNLTKSSPSIGIFTMMKEETETEIIASGTCGNNLTWTLDDAGTLTISGKGAMEDYAQAPWGAYKDTITNVILPDGLTSIGRAAFLGCSHLTSVFIPDRVSRIGKSAFFDCSSLAAISIPDGVSSVESFSFSDCTRLTTVSIPNSVSIIGEGAFQNCSSIAAISIPDGISNIESFSFYGCSSLAAVSIPNSVTSIGEYAFSYCSSLTAISIPDSITSIERDSFSSCTGLIAVSIPDSVTRIGDYAFNNCTSLPAISIPDSVTSIGVQAFRTCLSLTAISIPNSVTSIGSSAFQDCSSLTTVSIPENITSLSSQCFYDCTSLTSVYFYGDAPTIATNTFKNTPSSLTLYYISGKSGWTSPTWTDSNGVTYNTATFTPGAVDPKPTIPGDISGDGVLDYFDVTALYAAYQSGEVDAEVMDVNHDGVVDYYDVSKLYAAFRGTATLT